MQNGIKAAVFQKATTKKEANAQTPTDWTREQMLYTSRRETYHPTITTVLLAEREKQEKESSQFNHLNTCLRRRLEEPGTRTDER